MFIFFRNSFPMFAKIAQQKLYSQNPLSLALKASLVSAPFYFLRNYSKSTLDKQINLKMSELGIQSIQKNDLICKETFLSKTKNIFFQIVRFFHLIMIFTPSLICLPLRYFKTTEKLWINIFVSAVQRAGVVWIKAFQYLSHRRDVIGNQLAENFVHLRQNAPTHSFEQTKKSFKLAYGKQINQIFEQFETVPIASGSVSQVYKAKYHGRKVAVKVRHPDVDKYIKRDIDILFMISRICGYFNKNWSIPIGEESMKKTLTDQIDFNIEKQNLNQFNKMFKGNKYIHFPFPFQSSTRDSILVETFAEGVPITYFQNNRHPLNAAIARLGAMTFFEMLMKNNFIHADCHGGNILVELTDHSSSFFGQIWSYIKEKYYKIQQYFTEQAINQQNLKTLYHQSKKDQAKMRKMLQSCKDKVKITMIDVGMVIRLDENDKQNFVNFIKSVIQGEGERCAQMIYKISNFQGKKIIQGKFQKYAEQLKNLFSVVNKHTLVDIQGMQVLSGMLDIIRDNNMKLDGQFATLITNIVVLEAMAKDLDPKIQILKCAVPYFDAKDFLTMKE